MSFYLPHVGHRWTSVYPRLDLFDNLVLHSSQTTMTVYFGVSTMSTTWSRWSNAAISKIEEIVQDDFAADGYKVGLTRITQVGIGARRRCSSEFMWKLLLRPY
jgi:hypothetical protein